MFTPAQKRQLGKLLLSSRITAIQIGELHLEFSPPTPRYNRAILWCAAVGDKPPTAAYLVAMRERLERDGRDVVRSENAVRFGGKCGYTFTWTPIGIQNAPRR